MTDNTVVFDGKTYDLNELSDECQLACSLLQEVQQEVVLQSRKLDIYRASSVTLTQKVKELVSEDALVDEVASMED